MFKKIFVILLLLVFLLTSFIIYNNCYKTEKNNTYENVINDILEQENIESYKETEEISQEEIDVEDSTPKISISEEKNNIPTKKEESSIINSSSENVIIETKENNDNTSNLEKNTSEIKTEEQPINAWDELGITEYDYYYSPMWNWQDVNFGIYIDNENKCNNMSDCRNKCINYGELLLETNNGGYTCNEVYSHSNNYLGEQFIFKYLEQ